MYPIVALVARAMPKSISVPGGPLLKRGSHVATFTPALHYSEENFAEPYKFIPERFEDKG